MCAAKQDKDDTNFQLSVHSSTSYEEQDFVDRITEVVRNSVAEPWHGKLRALGAIPGSSTFLSSTFPAISKVYEQ